MTGAIATPSGDIIACATDESSEVYSYSLSKQTFPLTSVQEIQSICEVTQDHREQRMKSESPSESVVVTPVPSGITPLANLCMPLQPRRTWSAEDERRRRLEEDPDAYDVGPHSVTCAGCHRPIRLNATGRYYAANWNKHKMGCKNTNAVSGTGAITAASRFTGRVAAFRVAKPSESSELYTRSPTTGTSDVEMQISSQALNQTLSPLVSTAGIASQSTPRDPYSMYQDSGLRTSSSSGNFASKDSNQTPPFSHPAQVSIVGSVHPLKLHGDEGRSNRPEMLCRSTHQAPRFSLLDDDIERPGYFLRTGKDEEQPDTSTDYIAAHGVTRTRSESIEVARGSLYASSKLSPLSLPQRTFPMPSSSTASNDQQKETDPSPSSYPGRLPPDRQTSSSPEARVRHYFDSRLRQLHQPASVSAFEWEQRSHSGEMTSRTSVAESRFSASKFSPGAGKMTPSSSPDLRKKESSSHPGTVDENRSSYRALARAHDHTLPSLSSLTLQRPSDANLPPSRRPTPPRTGHTDPESYTSANLTLQPLGHHYGPSRREQSLVWPQDNSLSTSKSSFDHSESVILPPIWSVSSPEPCISPMGTKRRLGEAGEHGGGHATIEDKLSPQRLHGQSGRSPGRGHLGKHATPPADSPRFKISRSAALLQDTASSEALPVRSVDRKPSENTLTEAIDVGGASHELSVSEPSTSGGKAGRLHPVWKWEQLKGNSSSLLTTQHDLLGESIDDNDVDMSAQGAS